MGMVRLDSVSICLCPDGVSNLSGAESNYPYPVHIRLKSCMYNEKRNNITETVLSIS